MHKVPPESKTNSKLNRGKSATGQRTRSWRILTSCTTNTRYLRFTAETVLVLVLIVFAGTEGGESSPSSESSSLGRPFPFVFPVSLTAFELALVLIPGPEPPPEPPPATSCQSLNFLRHALLPLSRYSSRVTHWLEKWGCCANARAEWYASSVGLWKNGGRSSEHKMYDSQAMTLRLGPRTR